MRRRDLLASIGTALFGGLRRFAVAAAAGPSATASANLLTAPLELTGRWEGSRAAAAARVIERVRQVTLAGVRLVSDRQPQRLRVDAHVFGPPAIWLHAEPAATAWIIVDIGPNAWCQLAYQFGHELGHVLCNSWAALARPAAPSQWLEEALAEGFSIRGLGLLAESWQTDPPFPGDSGYAGYLRKYRADLIAKYRVAAPPGADIAACYRSHCRDFTRGKGDPLVLAVVGEMEREPAAVADLGALNRWPARGAVPEREYLVLWRKSCAELGAPGSLPVRLAEMLDLR